jgi:hypothetical protein
MSEVLLFSGVLTEKNKRITNQTKQKHSLQHCTLALNLLAPELFF